MKKILAFILIFTVAFSVFAFGTEAVDGQKMAVFYRTESENLQGAVFHVYRIGDVSGTRVVPNSTFAPYSVDYDISTSEKRLSLAQTLSAYILRDDIVPLCSDTTDTNGVADFEGRVFEEGVYIVMADKHRQNDCTYFCTPSLVVLPYEEEESVVLNAKFESVPDDTKTISVSYKVVKSWVEVDGGVTRPVEIEVELLRDGEVYDTVILNEDNNWRYQWDGLSVFYHWTVTEKYVIGGYVVSLSQYDKTLFLTNSGSGTGEEETTTSPEETTTETTTEITSAPDDTTDVSDTTSQTPTTPTTSPTTETTTQPTTQKPDDEPELPVTGTLRWPIPYLALAGVFFLIIGYAKYRKSELADE